MQELLLALTKAPSLLAHLVGISLCFEMPEVSELQVWANAVPLLMLTCYSVVLLLQLHWLIVLATFSLATGSLLLEAAAQDWGTMRCHFSMISKALVCRPGRCCETNQAG